MARIGLAEKQLDADLSDRALQRPALQLGALAAKKELDAQNAPLSAWDAIPNGDLNSLEHALWTRDADETAATGRTTGLTGYEADYDAGGQKMPTTADPGMAKAEPSLFDRTQELLGARLDTDPRSKTYRRFVRGDGSFVTKGEFSQYAPQVAGMYFLDTDPKRALKAQDERLGEIEAAGGEGAAQAREKRARIAAVMDSPEEQLKMYRAHRDYISQFSGSDVERAAARLDRKIAVLEKQAETAGERAWEEKRDEKKYQQDEKLLKIRESGSDRRTRILANSRGDTASAASAKDHQRYIREVAVDLAPRWDEKAGEAVDDQNKAGTIESILGGAEIDPQDVRRTGAVLGMAYDQEYNAALAALERQAGAAKDEEQQAALMAQAPTRAAAMAREATWNWAQANLGGEEEDAVPAGAPAPVSALGQPGGGASGSWGGGETGAAPGQGQGGGLPEIPPPAAAEGEQRQGDPLYGGDTSWTERGPRAAIERALGKYLQAEVDDANYSWARFIGYARADPETRALVAAAEKDPSLRAAIEQRIRQVGSKGYAPPLVAAP